MCVVHAPTFHSDCDASQSTAAGAFVCLSALSSQVKKKQTQMSAVPMVRGSGGRTRIIPNSYILENIHIE